MNSMNNPLSLPEAIDADPWLAVRIDKVRYYYPGQYVLWHSEFCGVMPARIIRAFAPKFGMEPLRWRWVINLGLPQPPSHCQIAIGDETMTVDVFELDPAPPPTFHQLMEKLRTIG